MTDVATVERMPARPSAWFALTGAVVAVGATAPSIVGVVPALGGVVGLFVALRRGSHRALVWGVSGLFGGVLLAGVVGVPSIVLVIAAIGTVVAWDSGEHALGLGDQLGDAGPTTRSQLVHGASTAAVATVAGIGSYALYLVGTGGRPTVALVLLLAGALALVAVLSR